MGSAQKGVISGYITLGKADGLASTGSRQA